MGYTLDTQMWPIVHFKFIGHMTAAETDRYFNDSDAIVNGGRSYVCVMDGTEMLIPSVEFVRRQADWIRANREAMRRVNRGIVFVMTSAVIRGLVRAVMRFERMPVDYIACSKLEEGIAWARTRVDRPSSA